MDQSGFGIVPRYLRGTLTAYEIAMYVALSWRADQEGVSWAGQNTLAEDAGMSRSTVQRALRGLEAKGLVKSIPWVNGKGRTSNVYALKIWAEPVLSEGTVKRQDGHGMKAPAAPSSRSDASDAPPGSTSDAQIQSDPPPSQGTSPAEEVGVRLTDADPRVSQTQRKKNQKNETQSSTPSPTSPETPMEKLTRWPGREFLAEAGRRWKWLTVESAATITQAYFEDVKAKGWQFSPEGWLKFIEQEDLERAKRAKTRAYTPNGVPL